MSTPVIPQDFAAMEARGFVQSLREPSTPYISPKRLSAALGVPAQSFAADSDVIPPPIPI